MDVDEVELGDTVRVKEEGVKEKFAGREAVVTHAFDDGFWDYGIMFSPDDVLSYGFSANELELVDDRDTE